ncbi:MAG: NUDIX hydrolase [Acidimicrobiia bacterium]|nr:NUDIX hydrolase [Acidimicrobiia bacterium]
MRWTVHGERAVYTSDWLSTVLVDVEPPGAERFEHHALRFPAPAAGTVVHDPDRGVLLLWRHRFITDTWGWEVPGGGVDPGESLADAAARETLEETGWRPGPLTHLTTYHPSNGVSDQTFAVFAAEGATHVGEPSDPTESERVEWRTVAQVRHALRSGEVRDGLSVVALCWALAFGILVDPATAAADGSGDEVADR